MTSSYMEAVKRDLDQFVGMKNVVGIDKESLRLYVKEEYKDCFQGVSKNKVLFKHEGEEVPLYPFKRNSKIFKKYLKILNKHKNN